MRSDSIAFAKLRLIRSANIGPVSYRQLIRRYGTAANALDALPDLAVRGGRRAVIADARMIESEIAAVARAGATYLFQDDPHYPRALAMLSDAPVALTWRGNLTLLDRPMVSIVGARNASAAACRFARQISFDLCAAGYTVVSGLARGIDTAAHQGAMGDGATIAVIASGIDIAFPPENRTLQHEIGERQLLIAEQPPGTEPLARHFPYRNRIIAGLSAGTVVVEAAPRSGSLITARLAGEYGREVMAVPGSPLDQRAQGCNGLIRDGATLVQSAADIAETLQPLDARMMRENKEAFALEADVTEPGAGERSDIAALLGHGAVAVDELVRQSGASPGAVQLVLLELDLAGRLDRHAGNRVSLR